jgi:hypothetical protein
LIEWISEKGTDIMIRKNSIIFVGFLVLVIAGQTALAQGGNDSQLGRLRQELDRTDEMIAQARELVQLSQSALAAQALERAVTYQNSARDAFRGQRYAMASSLTRKAREQASLAISNSRLSEQLEGVVQGRLERAREMLERARDALPTPLDPTVQTLLENARNNLTLAWQFYRQKSYKASAKLIEQVEQAANRLMNIARHRSRAASEFEQREENMLRLLEHAQELVADCDSKPAPEHLEQARHNFETARRLKSENQPRASMMALNRAREMVRRAIHACQEGRESLEQQFRRLTEQADRLTGRLQTDSDQAGNDAARELLEQARDQLTLANKNLEESKRESAQIALRAAQLALRQAHRYLSGGL